MKFSKPVPEIINQRSSQRSYKDQPLPDDVKQKLEAFFQENAIGPMNNRVRFQLIGANADDPDVLKDLGTYGFIKNAPAFIAGAVHQAPMHIEDYGFLMEQIILYATDLGLGTCWLGGTFNKSNFANAQGLEEKEVLPAVSPVGYVTDNRSTRDRLIRWGAGSKKRLPFETLFFRDDFETPLTPETAGDYALPLEMVRLGPSASNKQPWRIIEDKNTPAFHFFLKRSKGYQKNTGRFGAIDLQRLDMGIAMCHFRLTAEEAGLTGKWEQLQHPAPDSPELTQYVVSFVAGG